MTTPGAWAAMTAGLAACALATAWAQLSPKAPAHPPGVMEHVRALDVATVHGHGDGVRAAASWLATQAPPWTIPDGTAPFARKVREAAAAAATTTDMESTARATAALATSCGACHIAARVRPTMQRMAPPPAGGIAARMTRHQVAADLLLEGLIVPSDDAWSRGAAQLRDERIGAGHYPVSERIGAMMAEIEARLHAQAGRAASATDTTGRTSAYATLLTVCAQCHTKHTTLWEQP